VPFARLLSGLDFRAGEVPLREKAPKSARTANPVKTTAFFGVKKGFLVDGADARNPGIVRSRIE